MSPRSPTVLIVDDTLENLQVLGEMLELDGYDVRIASQSVQALELAQRSPPDLILLDVMMPGMDGHEVCRRLKALPATADIPIIFLTALTDEADEALGLDLGAVDYITKPFKMNLVRRRIHNHLVLRRLQVELESQVAARTQQLSEANDRLRALNATKAQFLRLLAHEVQAPANGLIGISRLALLEIEDPTRRQRLQTIFDGIQLRLEGILAQYQRLVSFQEIGWSAQTHPVRLEELLKDGWKELSPLPLERSYIVSGDRQLLLEALKPIFGRLSLTLAGGDLPSWSFEESDKSVTATLRGCSPHIDPERFRALDDWSGDVDGDLSLSAILIGALGGSASCRGSESHWEFRLTLPTYQAH